MIECLTYGVAQNSRLLVLIVYDDCVGVAGGSLVGEDVGVEGAAEVAAVATADDRGVLSVWRQGKGFFDS